MKLLKTDVEFAIFKMAQERKTATEMLARNANRKQQLWVDTDNLELIFAGIWLARPAERLERATDRELKMADESLARAAESLANLAQ